MSILALLAGSLSVVRPITVNTNWGSVSDVSPIVSSDRILTVPGGNPGNLAFSVILAGGTITYRKNGGAYTALNNLDVINFANSDTLGFRLVGVSADDVIVTVTDNSMGDAVGSWEATIA